MSHTEPFNFRTSFLVQCLKMHVFLKHNVWETGTLSAIRENCRETHTELEMTGKAGAEFYIRFMYFAQQNRCFCTLSLED